MFPQESCKETKSTGNVFSPPYYSRTLSGAIREVLMDVSYPLLHSLPSSDCKKLHATVHMGVCVAEGYVSVRVRM